MTDKDIKILVTGDGGAVVIVDDELSLTSENPVQNKVITSALNGKQNTLTPAEKEEMVMSAFSAGMHRNIFRGKNLGTSVTAAQLAAIADGSFNDLYVGDYWVINGINWRIADFDYFCNHGFTTHHANIVPDVPIDTVATTGNSLYGSSSCTLRTTGMDTSKTIVNAAFPDMVLTIARDFCISSTIGTNPSAIIDSTVDPMTAGMIYGFYAFGSFSPYSMFESLKQFALFRLAPQFIGFEISENDPYYWTVTPSSSSNSGLLAVSWQANCWSIKSTGAVSSSMMVRPTFAIGVADANNS